MIIIFKLSYECQAVSDAPVGPCWAGGWKRVKPVGQQWAGAAGPGPLILSQIGFFNAFLA